ncbi:MAG TPA: TonB C-terminal domain-containing protein [Candidatus Hydrogenedens sp.]|nr:TonB C-terminal domain-containing protein [Candidatus Hydrogenedens sp.]
MSIYIFISLVIHLILLTILMRVPVLAKSPSFIVSPKPIRVEFVKQEQQKTVKKLVEVTTPSDEAPTNTENIAEFNSLASGPEKKDGDQPGPSFTEESNFETLGSPPQQTQLANVIPQPKYLPAKEPKEKTSKKEEVPKLLNNEESGEEKAMSKKEEVASVMLKNESPKENEDEQQPTQPEYLMGSIQKPQGKLYNQVKKEGILGFEAIQDQLAPYLREIQKKVEQHWIHYLLTRYSGTKPTEVVIDCEINSEGQIVKIEIVNNPDDPLYAGICKQALQKSAPFSPFPFQAPDIYKNKNLQIRWTFNFM